MHVDAQFTKENQRKPRELFKYNPKKILKKLIYRKSTRPWWQQKSTNHFEALLRFYYDLSMINPDMLKFFPSHLQQADGTYLLNGKNGLHAFNDYMRKVHELRKAHDNDFEVLDLYFDRAGGKTKK